MKNWSGNIDFSGHRIHAPETVDELRRVVSAVPSIRVIGSGHSCSAVLEPVPDLVRLDQLRQSVEIDAASRSVTVGAATRYGDLCPSLHKAGFALANLASLPDITVAGACLTGTHGSGDSQRGLACAVSALELVGPDGELMQLRRDQDDDGVFQGCVVSLGALGVVTRLTLDIEPAFHATQTVRVGVPLDALSAEFDAVFGAAYSVSAFTLWNHDATVWFKCRQDHPGSLPQVGKPAREPVHPVPGCPPASCTDQTGRSGAWYERLLHFRVGGTPAAASEVQSEYFLPRAAAPAAIAAVRELRPVLEPVLRISEIRTTRGDDLWLSPAYGRDSTTFHFAWTDDLTQVWPAMLAVEERLAPLGARPHWAKLTTISASSLLADYPRGADFRELATRFDPKGKFRNPFLEKMFEARSPSGALPLVGQDAAG